MDGIDSVRRMTLKEAIKEQINMKQTIKDRRESIKQDIVPDGYKKTELGHLPMEWEIMQIANIGDVITGSTPSTKNSEYYGGEYFFVSPADIGNKKYVENTERKLSKKGFNISRKIPKNSVLVTCIGSTIGKIAMSDREVTTNQQINSIVCHEEINAEFIYYALDYYFNRLKKAYIAHQAVPIINKTEFSKIPLPIPKLEEQQKIADVLSAWDRTIELKKLLIKEKEEQKKGLKETIFSSRGDNKWQYFTLGDIGEFRTSSVNKKDNPDEKSVNLLNYMDVYNNKEINQKIKYMKTTATDHQIKTNNAQIGDVFFTPSSETRDDIGHSAVVTEEIQDLVYSYHLIRFRINPNIDFDNRFRAYCFNTRTILRQMSRLCTGSTRYTLSIKDFESISFYLPPLPEQRRIAEILSTADREIELLKDEVNYLVDQKKGLMQLLLTGIVRTEGDDA